MRIGTTRLIEAYCHAEKLAADLLSIAEGFRKETRSHKRCLVAYRALRSAADELRLAEKDL